MHTYTHTDTSGVHLRQGSVLSFDRVSVLVLLTRCECVSCVYSDRTYRDNPFRVNKDAARKVNVMWLSVNAVVAAANSTHSMRSLAMFSPSALRYACNAE